MKDRFRIVVLSGGDTPEREISLATGEVVAAQLTGAGHEVEHRVIASVAGAIGWGVVTVIATVFFEAALMTAMLYGLFACAVIAALSRPAGPSAFG